MRKNKKKVLHDLIDRMPDGFTLKDLQYRLFILQKLEKAEAQLQNGVDTYSFAEMRELVNNWKIEKEKDI